ncbi:legume lectins beta domain containing protein [Acanthamoeba castellanii str. Neff]|uniref:Legume lectins beta domain containing protein n=1 Tax=Acanthamoeba castellanii (strain ATCC 30010 / Neff) TaxID=1257118 RepID=L8GYR5_ACACF|nr:legume lectins beta domain containing protein [Acanthamoeba castellanii str. Neff]ELR18429.1 legume lectins beta domain containing protein [Acanthamoeba castellanii str. Neff]
MRIFPHQGQRLTLVERGEEEEEEQQQLDATNYQLTQENVDEWKVRCTRTLFGSEAVAQPLVMCHGRPVCFACAATCHMNAISGWMSEASPLQCSCAADPARQCLLALGSAVKPVGGKLREAMLTSMRDYKRALVQRLQQRAQAGGFQAESAQIRGRLDATAAQMRQYEDPLLQARCLSFLPCVELERRARDREPEEGWARREALFIELLRWFKADFFSWVDKPSCSFCGAPTNSIGVTESSPDEARWLANRTEVYACTLCGTVVRFPRYNHADKLLETRRGRCGEWAQCFALCCRAMGYPTRMVIDWTDHVWVEVYSHNQERWVHADPCESAYDKPLLYEAGWGKKLSYVVAISKDEAIDVIHRYTRQWDQVLSRRTLVPEDVFAQVVDWLDRQLRQRAQLDTAATADWTGRRAAESQELANSQREREVSAEEAIGRTSGSQEWREARREMGCMTEPQQSPVPASYAEVFNYQAFGGTNVQQLSLVGSARIHQSEHVAWLTPDQNDQLGALWHSVRQPLNAEFFTSFRFQIRRGNGGQGADGFAFVVQAVDEHAIGVGGCELGYGGLPNSLAIEFDTYESADRCDDPNDNHISLHTRGPLPNSAHHRHSLGCARRIPRLADGRPHDVAVHYRRREGRLDVFVDDGAAAALSVQVGDLAARLGGSPTAWLGFTAATGGLSQAHGILSWSLHRPSLSDDAP